MRHSRRISIGLLLALSGALAGMGDSDGGGLLGGSEENEIPAPDLDFKARVRDTGGLETEVRRISVDGHTYLSGKRGEAVVTISFDRMARIKFIQLTPEKFVGEISLKSGEKVDLELKSKTPCYGEASFGTYKIQLKDLASVEFDPDHKPVRVDAKPKTAAP